MTAAQDNPRIMYMQNVERKEEESRRPATGGRKIRKKGAAALQPKLLLGWKKWMQNVSLKVGAG